MQVRILRHRLDVQPDSGPSLLLSRGHVRRLLCVLAVEANRTVPTPRLLDVLCEGAENVDPAGSLEQAVYNARQQLPPGRLLTEPGGYRLRLHPDDRLDLMEFREIADRARAVRDCDPAAALTLYERALALWGESPLGDVPQTAAMASLRQGLLGERRDVREEFAEVRLLLGQCRELIAPVTRWLDEDPFNEHLRGLLMLALDGSARKGAALSVYRDAVTLLGPGASPGMWLQRIAKQIAGDEPQSSWQPRPVWSSPTSPQPLAAHVDIGVPNVARIYDYFLGGKDNYAADRAVAERIIEAAPASPATARANREFLARVVRFLAEDAKIDQFLDIGCGLPTQCNVHEIVQTIRPEARVLYVDNDPVVLTHAQALLATDQNVAVIKADITQPDSVLQNPILRELINLDRPVAVLMLSVLHCISDHDCVKNAVRQVSDALVPGSYLAISHITLPVTSPSYMEAAERGARLYTELGVNLSMTFRDREQVADLFGDLTILEPGLVDLPDWHVHSSVPPVSERKFPAVYLCGLARKATP